jgi:HEAT repeat protein
MTNKETTGMTLVAGMATTAVAQTDSAAVNKALETLKTYNWGADREALKPIDQAIIATHSDAAGRKALEKGLVKALAGGISRSAQDYVCRKLRVVGTAQSVKTLAALLPAEETSHIARYALERIPGEKAAKAMRDALPKVSSKLKSGIIGSLGVRRDKKSILVISKLLGDSDIQVAKAAAQSLGLIGTSAATRKLSKFAKKASANMKIPVADACLVCAEQLLADGKKSQAIALYKEFKGDDQPSHVKAAAMKGILTATIKK